MSEVNLGTIQANGPLVFRAITVASADTLQEIILPTWWRSVEIWCNASDESAAPFQISHTGTDGAAPTANSTVRYTAGQVFLWQNSTQTSADRSPSLFVAVDSSNAVICVKVEG